jgi:hypothetical protein
VSSATTVETFVQSLYDIKALTTRVTDVLGREAELHWFLWLIIYVLEKAMSGIGHAAAELARVHNKYNLSGGFQSRAQVSAKWSSTLGRSVELDDFYNDYEPVDVKIETGFTPLKLFSLDSIEKGQVGYKWVNVESAVKLNKEWNHAFVVIMDDSGGGKPVIAVTNVKSTPVYASYSAVSPFKVSDSLADFVFALAKLVEIVYGEFNVFEISDDDGLNSLFVARMNDEISPLLGEENFERFFDYFYG